MTDWMNEWINEHINEWMIKKWISDNQLVNTHTHTHTHTLFKQAVYK